ncbi:MAG: hypothetical protein COV59_05375 [Candidatus Magasanikbacteria bacterium CG11_big_fil_rev_8_21_14_0_20_39_34]|uniref:Aminoglycoside phosphotransferase domain-containing protein n=1 Tax=Candidatus Magasanikbacteria bacterium CG11_big_fil_rev_8_21_14_0_20_39_34 TaxID=1974653 RepID=A0A2H0N3X9_9BACT|nr:MAG: hypothetical protein COV59_05375 [Candidatus Magasanikbacteria bacterium CG11_big_fil_rev_8_21_14_0_20_39_34]
MEKEIKNYITKIIEKHFFCKPQKITRMKSGICNEVYSIKITDREVIIRLNKENDEMKGSEKYIPLFRSKGIKVPEILASDYSKKFVPYYYQIQSKLEGDDINRVIATLSSTQLRVLANEIANIFKKLLVIPTNGKFGFVYGSHKNLKKTLTLDIRKNLKTAIQWGNSTGILDSDMVTKILGIFEGNKKYFDTCASRFYYDDMSSKNILVYKGKFNGLVDLDGVAYGDYLETVGRIMASWYGTKYGKIYTDAVMEKLKLSQKKRKIVLVYAILNRFFWMCENGIQFNQNTKGVINKKKAKQDRRIVLNLIGELAHK